MAANVSATRVADEESTLDIRFLEQSGAAVAIHALAEAMLKEKPEDPAAWLEERATKRKLETTPQTLRALLANARVMEFVDEQGNVAPPESVPVTPSNGAALAGATNLTSGSNFVEEEELLPAKQRATYPGLSIGVVLDALCTMSPEVPLGSVPFTCSAAPCNDHGGVAPYVDAATEAAEALASIASRLGDRVAFDEGTPGTANHASVSFSRDSVVSDGSMSPQRRSTAGANTVGAVPVNAADPAPELAYKWCAVLDDGLALATERLGSIDPPPLAKLAVDLAKSRLKLEALNQRRQLRWNEYVATQRQKLIDAAHERQAESNKAKGIASKSQEEPNSGGGKAGKGGAAAAPSATAGSSSYLEGLDAEITEELEKQLFQLEASKAPATFRINLVLPLRYSSDFADFVETCVVAPLRWALQTSFPEASFHIFLGQDEATEMEPQGADGVNHKARFPADTTRVVQRMVCDASLERLVTVLPDSRSVTVGEDGAMVADTYSGFLSAVASAISGEAAPASSGGLGDSTSNPTSPTDRQEEADFNRQLTVTSVTSEDSPLGAPKTIVVVCESMEPTWHLGSIGNVLFPILLSDATPSAAPAHLAGGAAGAGSASSSPQQTEAAAPSSSPTKSGKGRGRSTQQQDAQGTSATATAQQLASARKKVFAVIAEACAGGAPVECSPCVLLGAVSSQLLLPFQAAVAPTEKDTANLKGVASRRSYPINGFIPKQVPCVAFDAAAMGVSVTASAPASLVPPTLRVANVSSKVANYTALLELAFVASQRTFTAMEFVDIPQGAPVKTVKIHGSHFLRALRSLSQTIATVAAPQLADRDSGSDVKLAGDFVKSLNVEMSPMAWRSVAFDESIEKAAQYDNKDKSQAEAVRRVKELLKPSDFKAQ